MNKIKSFNPNKFYLVKNKNFNLFYNHISGKKFLIELGENDIFLPSNFHNFSLEGSYNSSLELIDKEKFKNLKKEILEKIEKFYFNISKEKFNLENFEFEDLKKINLLCFELIEMKLKLTSPSAIADTYDFCKAKYRRQSIMK